MKYLLIFTVTLWSIGVMAQSVKTIPEGTIVPLILDQDLSTSISKVGDMVELQVSEPVVDGDKVLIAKGSKAIGQVTDITLPASRGKSGKLTFSINYLTLSDGRKLKLTSTQAAVPDDVLINFTIGHGRVAGFKKGFICKAFVSQSINL